ncbi:DUF6046 domain-containing protein [Flavobacterium sp. N1994]|uniref:DUF6046 domain-containing protein n=1 Tax=Flavobacterium sp. N1994 TaxID=2986827 RepID=UPI0022222390|nr:DUF6046 domain-containing protein [Flavobacterium sp. N1994]
MAVNLTIGNLFVEAFGLQFLDRYKVGIEGMPNAPQQSFKGIQIVEDANESFESSSYGTPILFPITFLEGTYKKYNDKGEIVEKKMGTMRLPIATIMDFDRQKIIGDTKVNGGRGSVKEIYGFDNWKITINGILIPDKSQPQNLVDIKDQERELTKWDNLASAIEVGCELFTDKRIKYITILGIKFSPLRGQPNIRTFTIDALSDEPIELNIKTKV